MHIYQTPDTRPDIETSSDMHFSISLPMHLTLPLYFVSRLDFGILEFLHGYMASYAL